MLEIILGLCLIFLLLIFVLFLYCGIIVKKDIINLQRAKKIKDSYFYLIYSIGENYNQYEDTEYTKEVFQELVNLAVKGSNNDDESIFYEDFETNKKYNILMEEIE